MKAKTVGMLFIIGLFIPLLLACGGGQPQNVALKVFFQEFVDDVDTASDKYHDKRVLVSGEVLLVENAHLVWQKPYIHIVPPGASILSPYVSCLLSGEALSKGISTGDNISVEGTVYIAAMTSFLIEIAPESFELILNQCSPVETRAKQLVKSQPTSIPAATYTPAPTSIPATHTPIVPTPINTPQPLPTVTPVHVEWVTKTGRETFSIDIPSDWLSTVEEESLLEETQEYLDANVPGTAIIFLGQDPMTNSNISAIADFRNLFIEEPQPIDLEEYTEMQLLDLGDSKLLSVSDINISGLNGAAIRTETSEGLLQIFALLLGDEPKMACGSLGILLTGTVTIESQTSVVEKAMNSFQVLPNASYVDSCDDRKALSLLETSESIVQSTGTIAAVDLVEEFNNNAVAATQKYSGLDLVVEGEVTAIDYDFLGNPYVAIGSGDLSEINTVWCMVSDVSDVAELSVGDSVTVEGTFSEWDGFDLVLKPCSP